MILGLTFKENCPDLRNTRVIDVIAELREYGVQVDVHDPMGECGRCASRSTGWTLVTTPEPEAYDGVILAVAHDIYRDAGAAELRSYGGPSHVFCDPKSVFAHDESDLQL